MTFQLSDAVPILERTPATMRALLSGLLDEFDGLRAANLATLRGWKLTDQDLALEGEHPEFGPVTLRQLLATWVAHDHGHVAQTARVMARQYREAVGPWRAYLPVLGAIPPIEPVPETPR